MTQFCRGVLYIYKCPTFTRDTGSDPYLFIADQLLRMIKPKYKVPGAREVNLLVVQDRGIILLLPV